MYLRKYLNNDEKGKLKDFDKKRQKMNRTNQKILRGFVFQTTEVCSMVDPSILETQGFKIIKKELKCAIAEGPSWICDICWKFEFRKNVI